MWLRDFLPKDKALQNTRILLFGYRSDLKDNSSRDSIQQYARRFLIQLQHCRSEIQEKRRPIIFICHCFGGLLVKKALTDAAQAKTSEPDQAIFKSCAALLLFGVPNRGMDNDDVLRLVRNQNNSQLLRDLGVSSPLLEVIHQNFARVFDNIPDCHVVSFYEALDSKAMEEVQNGTWKRTGQLLISVTRESATYAVPNEEFHNQISLDSDHSNIVKYDQSSDDRFIIVLTKLKEYVHKLQNEFSSDKFPHNQPHFMVPYPENENFIGDSHVASWFKAHQKKWIEAGKRQHRGHLRLALCGLGGIGKTQDVLRFIYEYKNRRPVFWIHAGSITQFEADYRNLGSLAKIPEHDDPKQNIGLIVKQWLEGPQSGDWILVLDNADNMLHFYPIAPKSTASKESDTVSIAHDGIAKFIPRGSKGTIIVTTRDREVARNLANQNVIIKPELHPEQAIELFYHHCPNAEDTADDTSTALRRLLKELQYLPLAIVQVAAYLDLNRSISTSKYLEMFESKKESQKLKRLLPKPHHNIWRGKNKNAETILTTFSISFRQLRQQSKLADSLLQFMACIDRKAIPRDLLFQIHMDDVEDELLISEALDKLVNFSILQIAKVDFSSGHGYEIHSLVHLTMQTYLESEMDTALNKASTVLANTLPYSKYENWAEWRVYLPHAMVLLANLKEDSEASADLCMKAGYHLSEAFGQYSESLILYARARKLYAVLLGEENTKTLEAMHCIGYTFRHAGRLKEAQEMLEKVLEARGRTLGEEHQDTLSSMHNLAITYEKQGGRLKEVQELEEKVLEMRRRTLGEEHPDTLTSMQNLAVTYAEQGGRLKEVQELEEKVLEVSRRTLGEEHQDTLSSMHNLAITYEKQGGRLKEVQELEEKVRSARCG
ncbi:P-loop containing nucleoside triphosphate hydrolase protein [Pyronema domesticum]|nr:P-loop containing nucleoside triphosphate hydrolase protein [Pyronema domesticum]